MKVSSLKEPNHQTCIPKQRSADQVGGVGCFPPQLHQASRASMLANNLKNNIESGALCNATLPQVHAPVPEHFQTRTRADAHTHTSTRCSMVPAHHFRRLRDGRRRPSCQRRGTRPLQPPLLLLPLVRAPPAVRSWPSRRTWRRASCAPASGRGARSPCVQHGPGGCVYACVYELLVCMSCSCVRVCKSV